MTGPDPGMLLIDPPRNSWLPEPEKLPAPMLRVLALPEAPTLRMDAVPTVLILVESVELPSGETARLADDMTGSSHRIDSCDPFEKFGDAALAPAAIEASMLECCRVACKELPLELLPFRSVPTSSQPARCNSNATCLRISATISRVSRRLFSGLLG